MGARLSTIGQLVLLVLCASGLLHIAASSSATAAPEGAYRPAERDATDEPDEPSASAGSTAVDSASTAEDESRVPVIVAGAVLMVIALIGVGVLRRQGLAAFTVEPSPAGPPEASQTPPLDVAPSGAGPATGAASDYSPGLRAHGSVTSSPHVAVELGGRQVEVRIGAATVYLQQTDSGVGSSMVETGDSFARVSLDEERWVVRVHAVVGSEPTVDGTPLAVDGQVGFGTCVRVGPDAFLEPREGVAGPSRLWRVRCAESLPGVPESFDVTEHTTVVGREPSAQADEVRVRVPGQFADGRRNGISASHLVLWVANGDLFIRDERSSFGTFVNDERLVPGLAYRLDPRDAIVLAEGAARLVVSGPILTGV